MARRRQVRADRRESYRAVIQGHEDRYGEHLDHPWRPELDRLDAGLPVIVSAYLVDHPGFGEGNFEQVCLEPDGSVTPIEPVYADPDAFPRTVVGYRRPDGSLVSS